MMSRMSPSSSPSKALMLVHGMAYFGIMSFLPFNSASKLSRPSSRPTTPSTSNLGANFFSSSHFSSVPPPYLNHSLRSLPFLVPPSSVGMSKSGRMIL